MNFDLVYNSCKCSHRIYQEEMIDCKLYFTLPYFHNKTHWQQHHQQIQSCYSMSIGCCLGNSILISLLDNLCEFLDTSWRCSHKMIQYNCSFHNKPCMQWCNILATCDFCILVVDIFTRHTNITERSFKLILSTIVSSYDQFFSQDHCYNIVNHCRNIINHGHFSCSYILLSHWVYKCHWASENGPSWHKIHLITNNRIFCVPCMALTFFKLYSLFIKLFVNSRKFNLVIQTEH